MAIAWFVIRMPHWNRVLAFMTWEKIEQLMLNKWCIRGCIEWWVLCECNNWTNYADLSLLLRNYLTSGHSSNLYFSERFCIQKDPNHQLLTYPLSKEMNFSLTTCLLLIPTCLTFLGQTMDAAHIKDNYLESLQAAAEEQAEEVSVLIISGIFN